MSDSINDSMSGSGNEPANVFPSQPIVRFSTSAKDEGEAVREIRSRIGLEAPALVALFVSASYDRETLGSAIVETFGSTPVIGCTTAGEISQDGYRENEISGFALPPDDFCVETACIDRIDAFEYREASSRSAAMRSRLEARSSSVDGTNTFAFLLVDGMSRKEEPLTAAIHPNLGDIQLFGGSAGDGGKFASSWVYWNGEFSAHRAVLSLVRTERPFHVFRTQHFIASDHRIVVTASDPASRIVSEIDGDPATVAYARILGLDVSDLNHEVFACHPVVVKMGGEYFVRSIMRGHDDGSIEFACAIDQGVVLRLAEGVGMVANLSQSFASLRDRVGKPDLIIGCDCLFRRVEAFATDIQDEIGSLFRENNVVGFTSYGEQFNAVHVNQTLTGVAIGERRAA